MGELTSMGSIPRPTHFYASKLSILSMYVIYSMIYEAVRQWNRIRVYAGQRGRIRLREYQIVFFVYLEIRFSLGCPAHTHTLFTPKLNMNYLTEMNKISRSLSQPSIVGCSLHWNLVICGYLLRNYLDVCLCVRVWYKIIGSSCALPAIESSKANRYDRRKVPDVYVYVSASQSENATHDPLRLNGFRFVFACAYVECAAYERFRGSRGWNWHIRSESSASKSI